MSPREVRCPEKHVPYLSSMLAENAVKLHAIANLYCRGFEAWVCGDHWHVGHPTSAIGDECKALDEARWARRREARREARR